MRWRTGQDSDEENGLIIIIVHMPARVVASPSTEHVLSQTAIAIVSTGEKNIFMPTTFA